MKIKGLVVSTLFAFSCSTVVMAAGLISPDPFNGIYLGAQMGYGHEQDSITDTASDFGDFGNQGPIYGGYAGWGMTSSSFYFGLEGQYNFLNAESGDFIGGVQYRRQDNYEWNVGGRVGWVVGENTLLYGRGGYSELSLDIDDNAGFNVNMNTLNGYQVGLGFEHSFGQYFSVRGEYIYSDYNTGSIEAGGVNVGNMDVSSSAVRVGATLEF